MTYTLADIIVCCIVSAGMGYFWAMFRVDNVNFEAKIKNVVQIDMKQFWQQCEEWKAKQTDKNTGSVPK